jgi:hypothetical protein
VVRSAVRFQITLGQATAPTPDALLSNVITQTVTLARTFDGLVLAALRGPAVAPGPPPLVGTPPWFRPWRGPVPPAAGRPAPGAILTELLAARQLLEDSGYRSPSCLIAGTLHFSDFHQWVVSDVAKDGLLAGADANSLFRATGLDGVAVGPVNRALTIMLGRMQTIAHGRAADASSGEEPVDLAISVPPSLEVIGETVSGALELAVRVGFAPRVKDQRGVVVFYE